MSLSVLAGNNANFILPKSPVSGKGDSAVVETFSSVTPCSPADFMAVLIFNIRFGFLLRVQCTSIYLFAK
jgi:hypothetical protein